jgi:hypothetical protein
MKSIENIVLKEDFSLVFNHQRPVSW